MFDRYYTILASDARDAVEKFADYLNGNGSANVTQSVSQEAKKG